VTAQNCSGVGIINHQWPQHFTRIGPTPPSSASHTSSPTLPTAPPPIFLRADADYGEPGLSLGTNCPPCPIEKSVTFRLGCLHGLTHAKLTGMQNGSSSRLLLVNDRSPDIPVGHLPSGNRKCSSQSSLALPTKLILSYLLLSLAWNANLVTPHSAPLMRSRGLAPQVEEFWRPPLLA
jgi:hypothetical protein